MSSELSVAKALSNLEARAARHQERQAFRDEPFGGSDIAAEANQLRVGAGLDGRAGARPALRRRNRSPQGGSSPQPAIQTRPP